MTEDWKSADMLDLRASMRRKFLILYRVMLTTMVFVIVEFWLLMWLLCFK